MIYKRKGSPEVNTVDRIRIRNQRSNYRDQSAAEFFFFCFFKWNFSLFGLSGTKKWRRGGEETLNSRLYFPNWNALSINERLTYKSLILTVAFVIGKWLWNWRNWNDSIFFLFLLFKLPFTPATCTRITLFSKIKFYIRCGWRQLNKKNLFPHFKIDQSGFPKPLSTSAV